MRIAVAGFQHETNSFAPVPTGWAQFRRPGDFPDLQRGEGMLRALRGIALPMAGIIPALEEAGAEIVPLAWAVSNPGGPVTGEAFERVAALILGALSDAGPLDALVLELHGAMMAEGFPDAESELLRRLRAVVGPEVAITASLDPHANLTPAMVALADALSPYRTYPHVDMHEAGARAAALAIARARRGRPWAKAHRRIDFLTPITAQCTLVPPMSDAMAERARLQALHGCAELALCFGFPYCDFEGCGAAIAAFAEDPAAAVAAADAMHGWMARHEADFHAPVRPAAEGVAEAIAVARGATRPVILADTQDNPGGGGHGDTTGLLAELVRQGAEGAVLASINDAESAAACHAAGIGATLALTLGGRSDGAPLVVTATVEALTDGRFIGTGPVAGGNPNDLGPTALVRVAPEGARTVPTPGIRVIVASRKTQALDRALLTHLGIDPAAQRILALKSSVHFRADFQPIADRVIVVAAPGPVVSDPGLLPFRHLRPGLRLRPRQD